MVYVRPVVDICEHLALASSLAEGYHILNLLGIAHHRSQAARPALALFDQYLIVASFILP